MAVQQITDLLTQKIKWIGINFDFLLYEPDGVLPWPCGSGLLGPTSGVVQVK